MSVLILRLSRLAAYFALTLALLPVQAVLVALGSPWARRLPRFYHGLCCRIFGFVIELQGAVSQQHPSIFIANHASYLDIMLLGATLEASFIAKAEVARWPLFGTLARLQRTVFVERAARARVGEQRDAIRDRLEAGDALILFPEGTSSDGLRVLPFKSALFAAATPDVVVQPLSVVYQRLDGIPIGRFYRPFLAWYGDMAMAPHLWRVLGMGRITVAIRFHSPVRLSDFGSRKELAEHCRHAVSQGVMALLSGRAEAAPALLREAAQ